MFRYVFIPADPTRAIEERSTSKDGGLENDGLRIAAESYFKESDNAIDIDAERRATADSLLKQGIDSSQVSHFMGNLDAGSASFGSNVEIITVVSATPGNNYSATSMYCDNRAGFKSDIRVNTRATELLKSCGQDVDVRGDAFIGRAFDDESKEWERIDFTVADLDSGAKWIADARSSNAGRNMNAYRSSGVMQQMLQGGSSNAAPTPSAADTNECDIESKCLAWSQTEDEVEIKFTLPMNVSKGHLDVGISSSLLRVRLKSGESLFDIGTAYQTLTGATLAEKIIVDESTWSISTEGDNKVLTITLAKGQSKVWHKPVQ